MWAWLDEIKRDESDVGHKSEIESTKGGILEKAGNVLMKIDQ